MDGPRTTPGPRPVFVLDSGRRAVPQGAPGRPRTTRRSSQRPRHALLPAQSPTKTDFWRTPRATATRASSPTWASRATGSPAARVAGTPYWEVTAIPITPYTDNLTFNPLQVARVTVQAQAPGKVTARCSPRSYPSRTRCAATSATARRHRRQHPAGARRRQRDAPVRGPAGRRAPRLQRVPQGQRARQARRRRHKPLSQVIHGFHADKMDVPAVAALGTPCYACHPGAQTKCLRGRMAQAGSPAPAPAARHGPGADSQAPACRPDVRGGARSESRRTRGSSTATRTSPTAPRT